MKIHALVLDDDVNAHKAVCSALASFEDVEVVGRFFSQKELEDFLQAHSANVLFLDIEIGSEFGFTIARELKETHPELMIVFLTGHSSYAVDGYDFQPVNFLTKPINPVKLRQTIEEIRRRMRQGAEQRKAQLMFRLPQECRIVDVRSILYVERENRKNYLVLEGERLQIAGYTMRELEQMLSGYGFFLCHQSFLVNLYRIVRMHDAGRQLYEADVAGSPLKVPVSRNRYEKLKSELHELGIVSL